jgi:hypothetical protein
MSKTARKLSIRGLSSDHAWGYENGFYLFSHPTRLAKCLAHFELYKKIVGLPGHVMEFGVYKGISLLRFATFRNILENDFSRKIIGFDAFGKFPTAHLRQKSDLNFVPQFEAAGGDGLAVEELEGAIQLKGFLNIELIKGNALKTLPRYLAENPQTRISLLHLDMDVREPTAYALKKLYSRVVPGGLIVFDDYNAVAGETDAVDEFVRSHRLKLEKLNHYYVPAYVQKPAG